MLRRLLTAREAIPIVLCLQIVPLAIFPPSSYSLATQEWWLPILLAVLTIVALVQLLARRSPSAWPWYLLSFSQGFNIISRMMMLMPHATKSVEGGGQAPNTSYIIIAFVAMLVSALEIWYCDLPEVKQRLLSREPSRTMA